MGLSAIASLNASASSSLWVVGFHLRGDWLKIWIARQPRSRPRSIAFGRPPAGDTCAPISMRGDYEASLRTLPDGVAAHRRRAHGAVQLAAGAPRGRPTGAAHRG